MTQRPVSASGAFTPYLHRENQDRRRGKATRGKEAEARCNVCPECDYHFYLPAHDLYIEITTMNQRLVTKKNRKSRRLRELYPHVVIKILYQRDYLNLLVKFGLDPCGGPPH